MVKRILRYLIGTREYVFHLNPGNNLTHSFSNQNNSTSSNGPLKFYGLSDADWGGQLEESKSTSGYGVFLGNALISWSSKTQPITATSSTYAEYISCYHAATELVWTRIYLEELGLLDTEATTIFTDNESVIQIAKNHIINPRSKHFATKFHYLRQRATSNILKLQHIPGKSNVADMWTKPLGKEKFASFRCTTVLIVSKIGGNLAG
jgi:hypothetical protein